MTPPMHSPCPFTISFPAASIIITKQHIINHDAYHPPGQTSQALSSNFAPPSRSPQSSSSAQLYNSQTFELIKTRAGKVGEPYTSPSTFSMPALP